MNKTLTLEQILLHTYGKPCEMSDDAVMESLLITDESLNEEYELLNETRQIIENSMVNPPEDLVSKIISYSKALTVLSICEPDLRTMMKN